LDPEDEFAKLRYGRLKKGLIHSPIFYVMNLLFIVLEAAIEPLKQYISVYSEFHEILTIDAVKFAETACPADKSPEDIAVTIREYKRKCFFFFFKKN
jgi:hypothetical protein